jgi:acetaldehyde dehydrogenase / alcohol dehydrogenase
MSDQSFQQAADQYIKKATMAAAIFDQLNQEQVDKIVEEVCKAGFNNRVKLAKMAVEETGIGVWQDKVLKNVVATQLIYEDMKDLKTVGILSENIETGIIEMAKPIGPVLAVTPTTNPTSTVMFKILICLKTRNPIIIGPHPRSVKCCKEAARICYEAALAAGAPDDCIQIVEKPSWELTHELMKHPGLNLVLATGGPGLVKAAYSSGTPAIGVGSGNVPVLVDETADASFVVKNIIISKTFDNGTVCASEQAVVVVSSKAKELKEEFEKQGCYFLNSAEIEKIEKTVIDPEKGMMNPAVVGQSANKIAKLADINVPEGTKILLAQQTEVGKGHPLSGEILAPVLAFYIGDDFEKALKLCIDINYHAGLGHSAGIYSSDEKHILMFGEMMDAGRVLVNTPTSQGGVGGIFNKLHPSLTLGCGSGGKNITAENVTARNLINVKKVCYRKDNERFVNFPVEEYLDESKDMDSILEKYRGAAITVKKEFKDNVLTFKFIDRMDSKNSLEVEAQVDDDMESKKPEKVIFDLAGVDYVTSAFLRICITVAKKVGQNKFSIINTQPQIKKTFKISGLEGFFNVL